MEEILKKTTSLLRIHDHEHRRVIMQLVQQCTGISHSQHLLLMVLAHEDFRSQKEIATRLNISPAAVTMSLKKLESEGYITKNTNPKDTRFNFVTLTEKGESVVSFSRQLFADIDHELFTGFTEEELSILNGYLTRILDNLKRIEETRPFQTME
ncbi:MAG: MarR family transcriptional regulator [Clostridiales bacterium]|nr:MarR family transcriptional regulator [Clostridiales bacterium]